MYLTFMSKLALGNYKNTQFGKHYLGNKIIYYINTLLNIINIYMLTSLSI